jgi:hypothetical protein
MGIKIMRQQTNSSKEVEIMNDDGSSKRIIQEENLVMIDQSPFEENSLCAVDVMFDITKAKEDEGLVSGWANVAVNADGSLPLDWHDDIITPDTLEKAANNFMLDFRSSGVMHEGAEKGIVVESMVFTKEKQKSIGIPEGTVPEGWFITVKISDPEIFKQVKQGTFKMFSIQGKAKRIKLQ